MVAAQQIRAVVKERDGFTSLHLAAYNRHKEVVRIVEMEGGIE